MLGAKPVNIQMGVYLQYWHSNGDIEMVQVVGRSQPTRTGKPRWYVERLRDGRHLIVGEDRLHKPRFALQGQ